MQTSSSESFSCKFWTYTMKQTLFPKEINTFPKAFQWLIPLLTLSALSYGQQKVTDTTDNLHATFQFPDRAFWTKASKKIFTSTKQCLVFFLALNMETTELFSWNYFCFLKSACGKHYRGGFIQESQLASWFLHLEKKDRFMLHGPKYIVVSLFFISCTILGS